MEQVSGWAEQGGSVVTIPGTQGSGVQRFQQSFRSATVTVRDSSNNLATIYSDDLATPTAKANPFTASSTTGSWNFYTTTGTYTLTFSGGSILAPFSITVNVGLGNSGGIPSYAFASLPTSKTQNAGDLARVTDTQGGFWMDSGVQFVKIQPELNVRDAPFNATGDGTTNDRTALNSANTNATALTNGGTLIFPVGTYRISSNITFNSDVSLRFLGGAMLSIDTGVTVTINGPVIAGLSQIFSGLGTVSFGSQAGMEVYPAWWGAVTDGSTSDITAFTRMVAAANASTNGVVIVLPRGTSYLGTANGDILEFSNSKTVIRGAGIDRSIISYGQPSSNVNLIVAAASQSLQLSDFSILGPASSGSGQINAILHKGTSGSITINSIKTSLIDVAVKIDPGTVTIILRNSDISARLAGVLSGIGASGSTLANTYDIHGNYFHNIGSSSLHHAIYMETPFASAVITANRFHTMTGGALHRFGGNATASGSLLFSNNELINCGTSNGGAIIDSNSGGSTYTATYADNNITGTTAGYNIVNTDGVTISGGSINTTGTAIVVQDSAAYGFIGGGIMFTGAGKAIDLTSSGQVGWNIDGFTVHNIVANANICISVTGALDTRISNGFLRLNGGVGVNISSSADRIHISNVYSVGTSNGAGWLNVAASAANPITLRVQDCVSRVSSRSMTVSVAGSALQNNAELAAIVRDAGEDMYRHPGWVGQAAVIASNTLIALSRNISIFHVSGTTTINTIEYDGASAAAPFFGPVILIADGTWALGNSGNILAEATAMTVNRAVTLVFDGTNWYETGRGV